MPLQKYRVDRETRQDDDAISGWTLWLGGPSLARVKNCRWESLAGEPRVTAYVTGEPDTYFSQPAACSYRGRRIRGYLTRDDSGNLVFHHCYY